MYVYLKANEIIYSLLKKNNVENERNVKNIKCISIRNVGSIASTKYHG